MTALGHGELPGVDWLRRQELDVRCSRRVAAHNYWRSALPTWVAAPRSSIRRVQLQHIAVENILSFSSPEHIGPLGPVAALIGHNNAGKSNVFRALTYLSRWSTSKTLPANVPELEKLWHGGDPTGPATTTVGVASTPDEWDEISNASGVPYTQPFEVGIRITPTPGNTAKVEQVHPDDVSANIWDNLFVGLTNKVVPVSPQRQPSPEQSQQSALNPGTFWNGQGFKSWLNAIDRGRGPRDRERAALFRDDVRKVAGMENLTITVHVTDQTYMLDVQVQDDGGYKASLEDCGTGVATVILVIGALHRSPGSVLLIDDPEAHLHPTAQATFAKVVADRVRETGGQVIFATHSPAILDLVPDDQIFEVKRAAGVSTVRRLANRSNLLDSLRDLGYRPSLLQMADAVLVLEGAHDQAAVRAWWRTLYAEDPEPHVALMPVGGSSAVCHLDPEALKALGRRCFALLDSDRDAPEAPLQQSLTDCIERLQGTLDCHVLERRELENYFAPRAIQAVLHLANVPEFGPFDDVPNVVPQYPKGRAGAIAAEMTAAEIPAEIIKFLDLVRASTRAGSDRTAYTGRVAGRPRPGPAPLRP